MTDEERKSEEAEGELVLEGKKKKGGYNEE